MGSFRIDCGERIQYKVRGSKNKKIKKPGVVTHAFNPSTDGRQRQADF
jgi:translation elongation factor EF-1alpha